jgi:DNA-binding MarR family transcriptional regulator
MGDDTSSNILHLAAEAKKIASALEALAEVSRQEPDQPGDFVIDARLLRSIIRARRLRDSFFKQGLFADPAWDILLDLMAARMEGRRVSVSSLCIAAATPPTTALRWIKSLTEMGLIVRAADPVDGRRVYLELSNEAAQSLSAYLRAAHRLAPLEL